MHACIKFSNRTGVHIYPDTIRIQSSAYAWHGMAYAWHGMIHTMHSHSTPTPLHATYPPGDLRRRLVPPAILCLTRLDSTRLSQQDRKLCYAMLCYALMCSDVMLCLSSDALLTVRIKNGTTLKHEARSTKHEARSTKRDECDGVSSRRRF
jgi:hypothetical protein